MARTLRLDSESPLLSPRNSSSPNIDVITTGNHVWDKREIVDYFQMVEGNGHGPARRVLRPANYPADMPGSGVYEGMKGKVPYVVIDSAGTRLHGIQ